MTTGDNDRFTREWHEVTLINTSIYKEVSEEQNMPVKWFPYNKGGSYRKWYGNITLILKFDEYTRNILKGMGNGCASEDVYFLEGATWTDLNLTLGARFLPKGVVVN